MKSLKNIIRKNLLMLTVGLMIVILLLAVLFQILLLQRQAKNNAAATFVQLEQVIEESNKELELTKAAYSETCLLNAEVVSYMIKHNPGLIYSDPTDIDDVERSIAQFRQIADKLQVDEIHIFREIPYDNEYGKTGEIFAGTHSEYFNYTFEDGEQIGFFKPMVSDKKLRLCQDIMPNTADERVVQYSAVWSSDGTYIIQIGMYPDAVMAVTEKCELAYIFSLLQGNAGVSLYAINRESGEIVGSTSETTNGKSAETLGLKLSDMESGKAAHGKVAGVNSYCIFEEIEGNIIAYVISNDRLYGSVTMYTMLLACCLSVIAIVLVIVMQHFNGAYIVNGINNANEKVRAISEGNLDEYLDIQTCTEFSELSAHINRMVRSLMAGTEKMGFVLDRTDMPIGVYEYNTNAKTVRFTKHIPEIFGLSQNQAERLKSDHRNLQAFIDEIRREPIANMENTYRFVGDREMYVKLEELTHDNDVLGIVMDATDEILNLKRAEAERDIDLLTGIYNRRGMERRFNELFCGAEDMGYGAVVVIDTDNLKVINDTYGHTVGDKYLQTLAGALDSFDAPKSVAARTGGDEFVLLMYGYEDDAAVGEGIEKLRYIQENTLVSLEEGKTIPLMFSMGYERTHGRIDYNVMLTSADTFMYTSKRIRKSLMGNNK